MLELIKNIKPFELVYLVQIVGWNWVSLKESLIRYVPW
jgi:hypothetical protein